jgi:hypothetical protein
MPTPSEADADLYESIMTVVVVVPVGGRERNMRELFRSRGQ